MPRKRSCKIIEGTLNPPKKLRQESFSANELVSSNNKLSKTSKIQKLYINDKNTRMIELQILLNIESDVAAKIFSEKDKNGPFKCTDDLLKRIENTAIESINKLNVQIMFKSRADHQTEKLYNILKKITEFKQSIDELNVLWIIAQFSVGSIKTCDNSKCESNIVLIDHTDFHHVNSEEVEFIPNEMSQHLYWEYDNKSSYYFNECKKTSTVFLYCYQCYKELRHCGSCYEGIYFNNDDKTYNLCHADECESKSCNNCRYCENHFCLDARLLLSYPF